MRPRLLPPLRTGWTARVAGRDGLWLAVRAGGAAVAAAPTRASLARVVRRLGGVITEGRAPVIRHAEAHGTPFQRRVWRACLGLAKGETVTYAKLARRVGQGGARAVAGALARNPLARLIPCHRVVAAAGLGGFAWGLGRKREWLSLEGRRGAGLA